MSGVCRRNGLHAVILSLLFPALAVWGEEQRATPAGTQPDESRSWRIHVMDPLSDQIACGCVAGYARRDYAKLGDFLQARLYRQVEITFGESLVLPGTGAPQGIDLIIGKFSEVGADAAKASLHAWPWRCFPTRRAKLHSVGCSWSAAPPQRSRCKTFVISGSHWDHPTRWRNTQRPWPVWMPFRSRFLRGR